MDELYFLFFLIIPLIAQARVNSAYKKYSKINNSMNLTGKDVARMILDKNGLNNISIGEVQGELTDHYNPAIKHINLSDKIYSESSIASVAVAAHECGHAIQDKENYGFLRFRTAMVPVVNFTSRFSSIFIILGIVSSYINLIDIGILLLMVGLLFQLITLPVEFDASKRAKEELIKCGLMSKNDTKGTNKVLKAAAFTYVAGFLAMALQILRLIAIRNRD